MLRRSRLTMLLSVPLIVFIGLVMVLLAGLGNDPSLLPSALLNRPVPAFQATTLDGDTISPADFKGEVALLNVWATWCAPCREEHPALMELAAAGVPIYGLAYKDDQPAVRQWLRRLGDPYRLVIDDADGQLGLDLGVYGAPETFLLDAQGVIRYRHVGIVNAEVWQEEFLPRIHAIDEERS